MIENAPTNSLDVVPSDSPHVFNLVYADQFIGIIACDPENLTSKAPWGWRLTLADGAHHTPMTGTSADIKEAIADAERAYWTIMRSDI